MLNSDFSCYDFIVRHHKYSTVKGRFEQQLSIRSMPEQVLFRRFDTLRSKSLEQPEQTALEQTVLKLAFTM